MATLCTISSRLIIKLRNLKQHVVWGCEPIVQILRAKIYGDVLMNSSRSVEINLSLALYLIQSQSNWQPGQAGLPLHWRDLSGIPAAE